MTFEKVKEIIVDTLSCDEAKVALGASLTEDLGADSLDAVELNMALEEAFEISIPDEDTRLVSPIRPKTVNSCPSEMCTSRFMCLSQVTR